MTTENLQQFLEEEQKDYNSNIGSQVVLQSKDEWWNGSKDDVLLSGCTFGMNVENWIKNHDTRLINFVLDEAKKEVEKKLETDYNMQHEVYTPYNINNRVIYDISTLLENLKVK